MSIKSKKVIALCKSLEDKIKSAYEESVTISEAEKLAAEMLQAELTLALEYQTASLDARMRKSGVKSIRGAVYMEIATKDPKKPSDAMINAQVDMHEIVCSEQKAFDESEVEAEYIYNVLSVVRNAHIYFRGISKQGSFSG